MADNGLTTVPSSHAVKHTIDRLEADVKRKGMTVFARIDHAQGARDAGLPLRPTELLIFGNARGGTPPMQIQQTIGIDLPLKALAWEDAAGKVAINCQTRCTRATNGDTLVHEQFACGQSDGACNSEVDRIAVIGVRERLT